MKLDPGAEKVLCTLEKAGFEAYVVGGCVRDALMGKEPDDWDITTNALPEQVKALFRKTFDTGIQHGTVTVLESGGSYEVTTYRIDGEYTDHRRPDEVHYASDLYEDVARRDFTINAMAYRPDEGLKDFFGGQEDLKRGIIRCVGDPMQRFNEDALRMLRAVRFSSKLNFTIEDGVFQAIRTLAPTLQNVSRERVLEEITKTLMSAHPEGLRKAAESGLMPYFSSVSEGMKDGSLADFDSTARVKADRTLRFSAWLHRLDPEEVRMYLKSLKADNELIRGVMHLVSHAEDPLPQTDAAMRQWMSAVGKENMADLLELRLAIQKDSFAEKEQAEQLFASNFEAPVTLPELAVDGRKLLQQGGVQGKQIGEALQYLLQCVIQTPSLNKEGPLIEKYRERYTDQRGISRKNDNG